MLESALASPDAVLKNPERRSIASPALDWDRELAEHWKVRGDTKVAA
jgi:hypothetical protein